MTWLGDIGVRVGTIFGRTGDVVAEAGDYTASQILNDAPDASGSVQQFITQSWSRFNSAIGTAYGRQGDVVAAFGDYSASHITDDSTFGGGQTVEASLDEMIARFAPVQMTWDRPTGAPGIPNFDGWNDVDVVLVTNSAGATVRMGSAYPPTGKPVRRIINTSATYDLIIMHDYTSATNSYRFRCPNDTDVTIPPHGSVDIYYSTSQSRWFVRV